MDIVDSQVHLNRLGSDWEHTDHALVVDYAVVTMDALGLSAILIDEWTGFDDQMRHYPGYPLENGIMRSQLPFSERAVALHPDRFGYVARVDFRDPELDRLVSEVRTKPGGLCLRIVPIPTNGELAAFTRGEYRDMFASAEQHQVPMFVWLPGRANLLVPYLEQFATLPTILDHVGVSADPPTSPEEIDARVAEIVDLARFPNLALKLSRAPDRLSLQGYPFADALPRLRRLIDAFGAHRLMWASDHTQGKVHHTWAESLYYLLDSDQLSRDEKEWLLGRSVSTILKWAT